MANNFYLPSRGALVVLLSSVAIGIWVGLQVRGLPTVGKLEDRPAAGHLRDTQHEARRKSPHLLRIQERERQYREAGIYSSSGPGDLRLIGEDGDVDDEVLGRLEIVEGGREVKNAVNSIQQRASEEMARRMQDDPRRSAVVEKNWRALYIPGDLDRSAALVGNLRDDLEAISGKEKMEGLMKAFDAPSRIAYLGRSDVYIQVPEVEGPVVARIQFYDPVSGATSGGAELTDRKQLEGLLGKAVAKGVFGREE